VIVKNVSQIKYTGNKLENKTYYHYSGYPGGMKSKLLKDVVAKDPSDALKRAVYNMLPKNRLRKDRMKKLSFA
jgi:large subunit ribosomal protein L13